MKKNNNLKIKETELRSLIREALIVKMKQDPSAIKHLASLSESSDLFARREIMASLETVIMKEIERNIIIKSLDIVDPNKMSPQLQSKYMDIVDEMKTSISDAIKQAVLKLTPFPRNSQQESQG